MCINLLWMCIAPSGCPADVPMTGDACSGLVGVWCDYPNSNPALHVTCLCSPDTDASTGSSWTCVQSGACPATQPAYDLTSRCPGPALCSYDSTRCSCSRVSDPWVCGIGALLLPYSGPTPAS